MRTRRCIKRIEEREDAVSNTTTTKVCTGNRPTTAGTESFWGSDRRGGGGRDSREGGGVLYYSSGASIKQRMAPKAKAAGVIIKCPIKGTNERLSRIVNDCKLSVFVASE